MKTIANSVRIGMVRRRSVSPIPSDVPSSSIAQAEADYKLIRKQHMARRRISRSAPIRDEVQDQTHVQTIETPKPKQLHDISEVTNKQQSPRIPNSPSPLSSPLPEKQITTKDLNEIPSKSKWSTQKKILVGVSAALGLAALIIIPTVLGVLLTKSADSTSTTVTTTVSPTVVTASWSFDNTTSDTYGVYGGQLINGANYISTTSIPYVGHGQALTLTASLNQSFLVSTSFLNLSYTSFTIEAWIYYTISTSDRGIFGQCQCATCTNQCLYLILRSGRLYIGFTLNDLSGSATLQISAWSHIAFVYNYQTKQQILYISGVQDSIRSNVQPYQGQSGNITIGSTQVYQTTNFFNGYIDNVIVTTRAKSADEILRDASLMAYYSFDLPYQNFDNGPSGLNATSANTVIVTGRINQAMRFTGSSTSYFQAYGFSNMPYGVLQNKPFSISMWINPSPIATATIVQTSYTNVFTYCITLLGIYSPFGSTGQIQVLSTTSGPAILTGPYITQNTWTHISLTYSNTNGYTLYSNGILFGSTGGPVSYIYSGIFASVYISYYYYCSSYYINTPYQGSIDEVYIHNRELTQSDITTLANP